jgi:RNA polymerase sigma-70 factor, ECF subfamily
LNAHQPGPDDVQRLSAGDKQAEAELVRHFEPLLRMKTRMRIRHASAAHVDDVVQETFARVFTALRAHRVDQPERFGAFVNSVCENVIHELHRSTRRVTQLDASTPEPPARDNPEGTAALRESAAVAEQVLRELPGRDREILQLVLVDEADRDQVCQKFRITRDHLRVLVHRARERLQKLLAERGRARDGKA